MIKFVSNTYLKGVKKYVLSMHIKNNLGICIKKIKEIDMPFVLNEESKLMTILDNNYFILEIVPFDKNYILRVHLDDKLNIIERFYIITKNNCIIDGVLSYHDLKLSYVCNEHNKKVYNIDKFEKMKEEKMISIDDYNMAYNEINKLKNEINNNLNGLYKLDYKQLIVERGF